MPKAKEVVRPVGLKFDGGKDRWSLLLAGCPKALRGVVKVLTFGAVKYEDNSWQNVDNAIDRYLSAQMRHMNAILIEGPAAVDEESGLPHIDHFNTNGLFLGELLRLKKLIND